jgi:hypothetical protein
MLVENVSARLTGVSMRTARSATMVVALACSLATIVVGASPASAHGCTVGGATLTHGSLRVAGTTKSLAVGQSLRHLTKYRATTDSVVVQWFDNTATFTRGSQIEESCYGLAAGDPADLPALSVMHGQGTVDDSGNHPLALITIPAMVGPAPGQLGDHLHFVATEHHSATKPPTTRVWVLPGTSWINVTPYAGPQPGVCRHVISAKLVDGDNGGSLTYHLG